MWPTCDQPWSHGWMEGAGGHSKPRLRPHRNVETSLNHTESCWWFEVGPKGFPIDGTMREKRYFFFVSFKKLFFPLLGRQIIWIFFFASSGSMNNSKVWRKHVKKQPWCMGKSQARLSGRLPNLPPSSLAQEAFPTKSVSPLKPNNDDFQGTCFSPWFCFFILKPCSLVDHRTNSLQLTVKFTTVLNKISSSGEAG